LEIITSAFAWRALVGTPEEIVRPRSSVVLLHRDKDAWSSFPPAARMKAFDNLFVEDRAFLT
jgi:hypothetical protein